jgi:flavin-dependent dehydrogenase
MGDGVLNVGAYVVREVAGRRVGVSARRAFDLFVGDLPPAWGIHEANALGPVRSRPIPMAINRRPVGIPGMLVAGDAAGVVNPFSGEGISYAIECGELAARLIARTLQDGDPSGAASYPAKVRERYGRFFGAGRWFDRVVSNPFVMGVAASYGTRTGPVARAGVRYMLHASDR